jgi:hypothetical protein
VARVLCREHAFEAGPQDFISEACLQAGNTQVLGEVLEQDLNEDAAAGRGFLFVEVNHRQDMPTKGIVAEQMSKEPRDVAETICFVAVNGVVVLGKRLLEQIGPQSIDLGESLTDQSVELGVRPLLRATLDDHGWKLSLQSLGEIDFHQFVAAFFKVDAGHDRQVDCPSKIDQIRVALVFDIHALCLRFRLFV